jgi:hypothetical protein
MEHDDSRVERRPVRTPQDVLVAQAELRAARRIWAAAVERFGATWARGLTISFRDNGDPTIAHRSATPEQLEELVTKGEDAR